MKETKTIRNVVLVSGGMDSCVAAGIAANEGACAFLHAAYGQRTAKRELRAFREIADYYEIPTGRRLLVDLSHIGAVGGSALTDSGLEVPKFENVSDESEEKPNTYVPFRNTHILSAAVSWAEVTGATRIYIGAVAEDSAGYPDCRPEYFRAFNQLIAVGSFAGDALRVVAPLIDDSKAGIVKKGADIAAPLHLSWSCYERSDKACGKCDSCLRRLRAFKEAGLSDPIPYA